MCCQSRIYSTCSNCGVRSGTSKFGSVTPCGRKRKAVLYNWDLNVIVPCLGIEMMKETETVEECDHCLQRADSGMRGEGTEEETETEKGNAMYF